MGVGKSQVPPQPPQLETRHFHSNVVDLVGHNNVQQQLVQAQAADPTSNLAFVDPSKVTKDLHSFILIAVNSALARTHASGQGQRPPMQQT